MHFLSKPFSLGRARELSPLTLPLLLPFEKGQVVVTTCPTLALLLGVVSACPPLALPFGMGQGVVTARPSLALPFGKGQGVVAACSPVGLPFGESQGLVAACLPLSPSTVSGF